MSVFDRHAAVLTLLSFLLGSSTGFAQVTLDGQGQVLPLSSLRLGTVLIQGLADAPAIVKISQLPNAFESLPLQSHAPVDLEGIRSELEIYRNMYLLIQGSVMVAFIATLLLEPYNP